MGVLEREVPRVLPAIPLGPRASGSVRQGSEELPGKVFEELLTFAERSFERELFIAKEETEGTTVGDHLAQYAKSVFAPQQKKEEVSQFLEVDEPSDVPLELRFIWDCFREIRAVRLIPERIDHTEIRSYEKLMGLRFEPWEVRIVRSLDEKLLALYGRSSRTRTQNQES